jgi:hypothetical protein
MSNARLGEAGKDQDLNRTGNAGRRLARLRESSLSRQKGEAFEKLFMKQ